MGINSYSIKTIDKYALIEIPHFKNSIGQSCLSASLKIPKSATWDKPIIKLHNDADVCDYNLFSNSYYQANFKYTYEYSYQKIYTANMTIGCTYSDQIGSFDVSFGKKYIIEMDYNIEYTPSMDVKLQITDNTEDNNYKIATFVLTSILTVIIVLPILIGLFILYKKYCANNAYHMIDVTPSDEL